MESSSGVEGDVEVIVPPPALVSTVIAPQGRDIGEAIRARNDLENVGRMVQEEWREQTVEDHTDERIQRNGSSR